MVSESKRVRWGGGAAESQDRDSIDISIIYWVIGAVKGLLIRKQ